MTRSVARRWRHTASQTSWRAEGRLRALALLVGVAAGAAGCTRAPAIDLTSAQRLEGDWAMTLTVDAAPGHGASEISGTVALLVNQAGVRVADFSGIPSNVGAQNLPLGELAPGLAMRGIPDVVAGSVGDSVILVIGPGTARPIRLRGARVGDSVGGRWMAFQRTGPGFAGGFSMRRR